jgi:hypothetical protein
VLELATPEPRNAGFTELAEASTPLDEEVTIPAVDRKLNVGWPVLELSEKTCP